jgi:hypothetical protein
MIARYRRLFHAAPEAAIVAVYGLVHLVLVLAADEAQQVKAFLNLLRFR